jgi:hypothetical protein
MEASMILDRATYVSEHLLPMSPVYTLRERDVLA